MPYDGRFKEAYDWDGKKVRDSKTGNIIKGYCGHHFIGKFIIETREQMVAEQMSFPRDEITGITLVCTRCGEIETIDIFDIYTEKEFEKQIIERAEAACKKGAK